jgi:hypothetical protein
MKPTMPRYLRFTTITTLAAAMFLSLTGCVGVEVSTPRPQTQRLASTGQPSDDDQTMRAWCGVTLWAVILPIPLKLPVCKIQKGEHLDSPLYACGPLMVLGPIVHGYQGNALCGTFPN